MIHHHDQAITMTGWVPDRTSEHEHPADGEAHGGLPDRTRSRSCASGSRSRGEDPNSQHDEHAPRCPGCSPHEQLDELENAKGKAFDRLFLAYMTQHHEGAIQMVAELYNGGGGAEPEINQFALHVDSDQSIEIKRMAELAAEALICNT